MIDVAISDGIAVVTLRHGKANVLDIEFCEAPAARVAKLRDSAAGSMKSRSRATSWRTPWPLRKKLALLSAPAFAQTKSQIRQAVSERLAQSGVATNKAVTEIWTAPKTLGRIRNYVKRTLKKA